MTDAELLALYRHVTDGELLRLNGLFVAEGRAVVQRVFEDGRYRVHSLLVNEAARDSLAPWLDTVPTIVRDAGEFRDITGYNVHRGCLALVHRPATASIDDVIAHASPANPLIVLEAITNADNVGGVFRNASAFGAGGVILSPTCCDPFYRKAVRTSMAAVLRVPFARAADWPTAIADLRREGFTVVALTPAPPSEPLDAFAARAGDRRIALLVGTEGAGLSPPAEAEADVRVTIPMRPGVDSLNLSVAAGIALYELRTRRTPSA